ncbi:hypothetical protein [uncultured Clostridium sp.]|uniref:hypothetical protein n=1 Tax=uncultured Clostridium sp. TaxID=59620 RepID=UPI0028E61DE7|nr:hypothetical protein [uncultured Clostridium sp.]
MAGYYNGVSNANQGIFNNPRQKMWAVFIYNRAVYGTSSLKLEYTTNSFDEAKTYARGKLNNGVKIDDIIVTEIVPIDTVITP